MNPRKRGPGRGGWPDNLNATMRKDGRIYYYYRHPVTKQDTGFGYDKTQAFAAARQLNQLIGVGRDLVAKVLTPNQSTGELFGEYLEHYRDDILPKRRINGQPLSEHTLSEYLRIVRVLANSLLAPKVMKTITQKEFAEYLEQQSTAETYNKHRARLIDIFKHAVSEGRVPENIPAKILPRDKEQIVRQRLSLKAYQAIFPHASTAIQSAMELALNALQRRADIRKWRFDDSKGEHVYIAQQKTSKRTKKAFIRVPLSLPLAHSERGCKTLEELIASCRDNVACPYLVHALPKRTAKSKEKAHHSQLSRKQISDGFAKARDASGVYVHLSREEQPTFHEIISLGQYLREKSGWTLEDIQQLRGHTTARMTRHYLEGHEWCTVQIPAVNNRQEIDK